MTLPKVVIVGAGGFGREMIDLVLEAGSVEGPMNLVGVVDDGPSDSDLTRLLDRGVPFLGSLDDYFSKAQPHSYVIGIASPSVRRRLDARLVAAGHRAATLVHPSATVGSRTTLGPGTIICAGARLTTNIACGRQTHVNLNVTIGHDSVLSDYVTLNPGAAVSGNCVLEEGVLMGARSTVLQGLTIGADALVGAAALVTKDVPGGIVVKGVPAR